MTAVGILAAGCAQPTPQIIEKEVQVEKIVKETVVVEKEVAVEKVVKETVVVQKEVAIEKVVTATPMPSKYREAPMLAELVKAGKLPPVDERLPQEPMVLQPLEEIGTYGGSWRLGMLGTADTAMFTRTIGYEGLMRFAPEMENVIPNVAKAVDVSADGRTFTFSLRKGMKWSDGAPFTADDILFWYEDIALSKELTPNFPKPYTSAGKPCKVAKVDETTVSFSFDEPHGLFLMYLATSDQAEATLRPKHYLEQFHPAHVAADELDKKVKAAGFQNWWELFGDRNDLWSNEERPRLHPWALRVPLGTAPTVIADRNPYYWKVDTAGNQLPYLDTVLLRVHVDRQTILMDAVSGEIDMQQRHVGVYSDYPLLSQNAQAGNYRFFWLTPDKMCSSTLKFNMTHPDPVKREIYSTKDFRIALSYAINRQEIIETVYRGSSEPRQVAPWPSSGIVHERLATQYLEYDPAKANVMLDGVFPKKDAEGYRLGPDGKRIFITVEIVDSYTDIIDSAEMIKKYWADVGIEIAVKPEDRSLWTQRRDGNEWEAQSTQFSASGFFPLTQSNLWWPQNWEFPGVEWTRWYLTGGKSGELPPESIQKQIEMYNEMLVTTDPAKQKALFMQILDIAADEFFCIGVTTMPQDFGIAKNDLRNVAMESFSAWPYPDPAPTNPCTFFWKK